MDWPSDFETYNAMCQKVRDACRHECIDWPSCRESTNYAISKASAASKCKPEGEHMDVINGVFVIMA
jgi:hypothetical protein